MDVNDKQALLSVLERVRNYLQPCNKKREKVERAVYNFGVSALQHDESICTRYVELRRAVQLPITVRSLWLFSSNNIATAKMKASIGTIAQSVGWGGAAEVPILVAIQQQLLKAEESADTSLKISVQYLSLVFRHLQNCLESGADCSLQKMVRRIVILARAPDGNIQQCFLDTLSVFKTVMMERVTGVVRHIMSDSVVHDMLRTNIQKAYIHAERLENVFCLQVLKMLELVLSCSDHNIFKLLKNIMENILQALLGEKQELYDCVNHFMQALHQNSDVVLSFHKLVFRVNNPDLPLRDMPACDGQVTDNMKFFYGLAQVVVAHTWSPKLVNTHALS